MENSNYEGGSEDSISNNTDEEFDD